MAELHSPPVRLRRLARELRSVRSSIGLTMEATAAGLGWHASKLSRLENARSFPKGDDLAALLDLYGVSHQRRVDLFELAKEAKRRGWWVAYGDIFHGS